MSIEKNSNNYKIIEIISSLEPDDLKRMYFFIQADVEMAKVNFPGIVERSLGQMVVEKPNPQLLNVYNQVKSQNTLGFEAKFKEELRRKKEEERKRKELEQQQKEKEELDYFNNLLADTNGLINDVEETKSSIIDGIRNRAC